MTIADNKHVFDFCEALTRVMRNIRMIQHYQGAQSALNGALGIAYSNRWSDALGNSFVPRIK